MSLHYTHQNTRLYSTKKPHTPLNRLCFPWSNIQIFGSSRVFLQNQLHFPLISNKFQLFKYQFSCRKTEVWYTICTPSTPSAFETDTGKKEQDLPFLHGIHCIRFNYCPTCSLKDSSCFRALRSSSCCLSATSASCFSQTSFSSIFMANSISCRIPICTSSSFSTSWNTGAGQRYWAAFPTTGTDYTELQLSGKILMSMGGTWHLHVRLHCPFWDTDLRLINRPTKVTPLLPALSGIRLKQAGRNANNPLAKHLTWSHYMKKPFVVSPSSHCAHQSQLSLLL